MILKASQRGGAKALALHLLRADENEHVEVHELRGFMSEDLAAALKEAYAISRGTKCRQFLFSLSLSPPPGEAVPVAVFEDTLARIEQKLGLEGQPRAVVFHEKEGRRHAHAVWSRIDAATMTARNLPHFNLKLRDISRALYLEHDWTLPRGLMNSAARDPRNFTLAEWQQAKRMGRSARALKEMIQECWAASDSRAAFAQALAERGLILARGDRRGHVAVTHDGEVLSIARDADKKAKEVREKLGPADDLPSVEEAKAQMARDMGQAFKRLAHEACDRKAADLAVLDRQRQEMAERHRDQRARIDERHKERQTAETRARSLRLTRGLKGFMDRLTGRYARMKMRNEAEAYAAFERDRQEREALIFGQLDERQDLQQRIQATRDGHAQVLRDIRHDRDHAHDEARPQDAPARQRRNIDMGLEL